MLVDGAKYGDVEIPIFCYEPKLGQPVGACRMCLVEIEGIPKLQTACSTPIRDGMVVHTQTQRVHDAQRAVVEFLLVNHPLDCPVCDKGGECPLQDVTYGWGPGTSRFIEPKRHFKKPLELSPLIAIDRERCILCYRCVRYSQEVSEDYQLVLLERGAASYVGTFDGHPYVAPFSGNIIELCPVGALTSRAYRFRARPWDIEGAGTVCAGCPAQCNVELTVRDERVLRVLARDHSEVDDGWLCDKGRFSYQSIHADERSSRRWCARAPSCCPRAGTRRSRPRPSALKKAGNRAAALAGGTTTNEEAFLLQRLLRDDLGALAPEREVRRRAAARRAAHAGRPEAAGLGGRPRVRAHGAGHRLRPDRRGAGLGPADPQGRAPARHQGRRGLRPADRARPDRDHGAALRPRRRRGLPGRARRRADRRHGQPRRRRQRLGLQRHRDPRVRRRAARRGRGGRDPLRRARADGQRRPRAAQRRLAARPGRDRQRGPARAAREPERPRRARGGLRPRPRPGLHDAQRPRRRRPRDRRRPGQRRPAHGLAPPRRPAAQLPGPSCLGEGARHRAER